MAARELKDGRRIGEGPWSFLGISSCPARDEEKERGNLMNQRSPHRKGMMHLSCVYIFPENLEVVNDDLSLKLVLNVLGSQMIVVLIMPFRIFFFPHFLATSFFVWFLEI